MTARIVDSRWCRELWFGVIVLLVALSAAVASAQQAPPSKGTQKDRARAAFSAHRQARELALRKRVQDFYSLLQLGRWDQAASFIEPDSLDSFRKQPKGSFMGFEVQSVRLGPAAQDAMVVVNMRIINSISPTPVAMPQTSRWHWIKDDWYLEVPSTAEQGEGLQTMFRSPKGARPTATSQPEDLKFKGHRFKLGTVRGGEVKVARFPFTNVTDHPVTLSSVDTFCDCLQAKLGKKEFKPGESGEVDIAFDPKGFERDYIQTILVKTSPGDLKTFLTVTAFVVPAEEPTRKPGATVKPGS